MSVLRQEKPDGGEDPTIRTQRQNRGTRCRRVPPAFEQKIYRTAPRYREDKGGNTSWPVVLLMLVLLPPVGAVFMWQKLSYEKMQAYRNGQVLAFLGGVVAVLAARLPLAELRLHLHEKIGAADLKLMLIFGGVSLAGIVIMLLGIKISRAGELDLYLLYLIQERKITDLPMLADMAGISYKTLTLKLEKLIDGPLQNAYIYHRDKALILPGISERSAFRCGQCGATTVLYANEERICDYCGAPL